MEFIKQPIEGVWVVKPKRFGDARGYFCETFKQSEFEQHIGPVQFIQDNESVSSHGVLRGLHFQKGEFSQAKLVRVSRGAVLDVAVDLRAGSPTYGRHVAVELTADNGLQLFIPRGFAHGFVVLSDTAQFQYKVDNVYAPQSEATLRFDDPALGIDWRVSPSEMLLSEKDTRGIGLKDIKPFNFG
ncbi:MAG: dTDP-4-dehydrorhamnose 3,5-epimerase [Bacteroidales bacterium]|nr:dTDP-4-dehydrorhamnose 3,5-epimerase [Bacteroidales bacterium]MDY3911698.1 dTDP-4-dehydrorhamnose 3,5-epimerase [Sodaliphilus sp.]